MAPFDRCRRGAAILVVLTCLVLVPSVAIAQFASVKAPTLSVSTNTMVAPTAVTGTFTCTRPLPNESITFAVSGFTDTGPPGATYIYKVLVGASVKSTTSSPLRVLTVSGSQVDNNAATTWTLTIQSTLGNWTGPLYSKNFGCVRASNNGGAL